MSGDLPLLPENFSLIPIVSMKALKISLLGHPRFELGGQQVDGFVSEKALALFVYLVLEPGAQARERLAGLFWGDMPPERARANLRMAVYNLGQMFPGCLQTSRQNVSFDRGVDYWLDVEQFEKVLGTGSDPASISNEVLEICLSLYRGDLLEGIYLDGSPDLDEWLLMERERLRQLAQGGLQLYASRMMHSGFYALAVQTWRKLLRLEPWQESAHQGLMLALARGGEYTEALMQYQACRRLLAEELGVEPMPETTRLYERIRAARELPVRHNLPPQPTPFIGREKELKDLSELLADQHTCLITITGPGGTGKTRLALQAGLGEVHAFLNGVFFVPLESLSSPESLPTGIGSALGLSFKGMAPLQNQLIDYLRDREILLVLDNFEHILDGADLVTEILTEAPWVKILATSRQRLSLQEERIFRLAGLEYPESSLEAWRTYEAVRLFIEAGQRILYNFSPGEDEKSAVLQICRMLEGMPLGIELAAAWVDRLSIGEIAAAIEANLGMITTSLRNVPERHRSLEAVFEHSWSLLMDEERQALRRISIFRGGFTAQGAESIAEVSWTTLNSLVDKSLLQTIAQPDGSSRHRIHGVVRQFAHEKLSDEDEERSLREKHLAFFLDFCEKAAPLLARADQVVEVERIEREYRNLLEALDWSISREGFRFSGLRMAAALVEFWEMRGYFREGLDRLKAFLDSPWTIPAEERVKALVSAGRLAFLSGELELSRSIYEEGIRLCREAQNATGLLDSLNGLVAVLTDQGEYSQAARFGRQALALARQSGDPDKIALAANNLGLLGWYQGDYPDARRCLEESLAIRRQMGHQLGIGNALNNLALVALDEGEMARAQRLLEECLAIRRTIGDRRGTAFVLGNLGIITQVRGDFMKASQLFEEDLAIRRELEDRRYIAHTLCNLGIAVQAMGNYDRARSCFNEGLSIARRLEDPVILAFLSRGLGSLLSDLGEFEAARLHLEEALNLEREMGSVRSLGMALEKIGKLAFRMGELDLAQTILEEACDLFTDIHYLTGMIKTHSSLGRLYLRRQTATKACDHLREAFRIAIQVSNPLESAVVLEGIATLAELEGQPEQALSLLGRAAALREASGAPLPPADRAQVEALFEAAREILPRIAFQAIWEKGRKMKDDDCLLVLDAFMFEER